MLVDVVPMLLLEQFDNFMHVFSKLSNKIFKNYHQRACNFQKFSGGMPPDPLALTCFACNLDASSLTFICPLIDIFLDEILVIITFTVGNLCITTLRLPEPPLLNIYKLFYVKKSKVYDICIVVFLMFEDCEKTKRKEEKR